MIKFGFHIRTKTGHKVENIMIMARDQAEAARRLNQMYLNCEILEWQEHAAQTRCDSLDVEGLIDLISRETKHSSYQPGTQ